jgi:hypothetical protein
MTLKKHGGLGFVERGLLPVRTGPKIRRPICCQTAQRSPDTQPAAPMYG